MPSLFKKLARGILRLCAPSSNRSSEKSPSHRGHVRSHARAHSTLQPPQPVSPRSNVKSNARSNVRAHARSHARSYSTLRSSQAAPARSNLRSNSSVYSRPSEGGSTYSHKARRAERGGISSSSEVPPAQPVRSVRFYTTPRELSDQIGLRASVRLSGRGVPPRSPS